MKEFQEKHQFKRRLYSKTSLFILLIILIFLVKGMLNVQAKEKASREELLRVQRQEQGLEQRYNVLQARSNRLNTAEGIEAEIRSKYDVTKQGEGVIVVVDKPIVEQDREDEGMIKKIWNSVKGVFKKEPKNNESPE